MTAKTGDLVWFDIPVKDFDAAKVFYGELLGWKFEAMGEDYEVIKVGQENIGGLRKSRGAIKESETPIAYFAVDKLDSAVSRAKRLGGATVGERVDIPGDMGSFQLFRDKDGNVVGIWAKS